MRYLLIIVILLVGIGSSFWGCQKEDLGNLDGIFSDTTQAGPVAKMVAMVNDTSWSALSTVASVAPGQLSLLGTSASGQKINLMVYSNSPGDFLIKFNAPDFAKYYADSLATTVPYSSNIGANTGGIIDVTTIDTVNEVMSGFFNFISAKTATSKNYETISQGVFSNISFVNTSSTVPFSVKKNGKPWKANAMASVSGTILTISASSPVGDTVLTLTMPSNIAASSKPYPIAPIGAYIGSIQEKSYTLTADTTKAKLAQYKIKPVLTILSNDQAKKIIHGTFSFVADYSLAKIKLVATLNVGTFYLSY